MWQKRQVSMYWRNQMQPLSAQAHELINPEEGSSTFSQNNGTYVLCRWMLQKKTILMTVRSARFLKFTQFWLLRHERALNSIQENHESSTGVREGNKCNLLQGTILNSCIKDQHKYHSDSCPQLVFGVSTSQTGFWQRYITLSRTEFLEYLNIDSCWLNIKVLFLKILHNPKLELTPPQLFIIPDW